MKFLYIAFLSVFFLSCQKSEVKVPVNDNPGINEIWDNSPVYILMKPEGSDTLADLKLGKIITTTHWLVAVDKRLPMKKIVVPIEKIIVKRHKKTIHSKEGMHAYFTYLDSINKKIAFIDFDSISLMPDYFTSKKYLEKYHKADENYQKHHLTILNNRLILNDSVVFGSEVNKQTMHDSIWNVIGKQTTEKRNILYLNFDENMDFDRFLNYYTYFKNNPIPKGKISNKIFIFKP